LYTHAPDDYICPFCLLVKGIENEHNSIAQSDLVYQDKQVTSFIALRKWPNNAGHVLVIPNEHYENIYDLPIDASLEIQKHARDIALAMKSVYRCHGITLIQRNEPAGEQRAWHYHLHIIPRYDNDNLFQTERQPFPKSERAEYAKRLSEELKSKSGEENIVNQ